MASPQEPFAPPAKVPGEEKDLSPAVGGWYRNALIPWSCGLVAVMSHLPVLGAYWNQDDWGLLARAAGLVPANPLPARLVSQVLYWHGLYPLSDLATQPYTWTRLLLHGGCAVLVARLAARGGLSPVGQLLAGLLFAATSLAFTPLYWASGVQELLGAFFALAALDRWLVDGRRNLAAALVLGSLSLLSKENALGLPLFLAALTIGGARGKLKWRCWPRWLVIAALTLVAVGEAILVWHHFDHAAGRPYGFGDWHRPLTNLAGYGWWLATPGPFHAPQPGPIRAAAGGAAWLLWAAAAWQQWRHRQTWPATCLLGALLSIAPVLPLAAHIAPYFLYLTWAAAALALAGLVPHRTRLRPAVALGMILCATVWSWIGTNARLKTRDALGQPADPLVLRTAISHEAVQIIRSVPWHAQVPEERYLVLLQIQPPGLLAEMAERLGENWAAGTVLHTAIGGTYGPRLALQDSVSVMWANGLFKTPAGAFVLTEDGAHLRPWGPTQQASLYLALTEVAQGRFARAERHLLRGALLSQQQMPFLYDPDMMVVSPTAVQLQAASFRDFLLGAQAERKSPVSGPQGGSANRSDALIAIFNDLVAICCGRPNEMPE